MRREVEPARLIQLASLIKFALAMQQLEPTIVAMEACAAAHYWGRRLIALGHEVRLASLGHAQQFSSAKLRSVGRLGTAPTQHRRADSARQHHQER
jgi:transposase